MLLDEARLAARIRHPNVVPTLDVVSSGTEMLLVMEYVPGESLARLAQASTTRQERIPLRVASAVLCGALHGLHAAHEATDERGTPLEIVHRDVSPQNILVGCDGVARLLDFGVAKAVSRLTETRSGELKGKLAYMAPEQFRRAPVDRRADIYAAGVVLWELLVGRRLHAGGSDAEIIERVLYGHPEAPSTLEPAVPASVDAVVLRALARNPDDRYATTAEMAGELEAALGVASVAEIKAWVNELAGERLAARSAVVASVEQAPLSSATVAEASPELASFDPTATSTSAVLPESTGAPTLRTETRRRTLAWVALAGFIGLVATASLARSTASSSVTASPAASTSAELPSTVSAEASAATSATTSAPASVPSSEPSSEPRRARTPAQTPMHVPTVPQRRPPKEAAGSSHSRLPADLPSERE